MLHDQADRWELYFARGAAEAEILFKETMFDAAVFDITMPCKNGLELLQEVKENPATRDMEVIILTGLQDQQLKSKALDFGAADLLNKPVLKEDLLARLNSVIKLKQYQTGLIEKNLELERQLISSQRMELISIMAAGIIHDVKNIMSIIRGYPDIISLKLAKQEPVAKELHKIQDSTDRAHGIMMQLLKMTRKNEDSKTIGDLVAFVTESLELIRVILPKTIGLEKQVPDQEVRANFNYIQLNQALMNLVLNAGQAISETGNIKISLAEVDSRDLPSIKADQLKAGRYIRLAVSDDGAGISPEILPRIFEPAFTTKGDKGGAGLGLMVVKWITENHGGFVTVDTEVGKGTTFGLFLPKPEAVA
jgi:signal transduction histidine kinase